MHACTPTPCPCFEEENTLPPSWDLPRKAQFVTGGALHRKAMGARGQGQDGCEAQWVEVSDCAVSVSVRRTSLRGSRDPAPESTGPGLRPVPKKRRHPESGGLESSGPRDQD